MTMTKIMRAAAVALAAASALLIACVSSPSHAQSTSRVVSSCGLQSYSAGAATGCFTETTSAHGFISGGS